MKWLIDCADVAIPPPESKPAISPPADRDTDVPIKENGEPLVPLSGAIRTYPVYSWMGFENASLELRVRAGVLARLERASAALRSDGFEIVVVDGHRTRALQAELMTYYQNQEGRSLEGYVSDPYSTTLIPPHTTGGAVDLTLAWHGAVLGLGTDFDDFSEKSWPAALEGVPGPSLARDLRRLLASALQAEGMVVIGTEWWHWSFGDQWWAAQTGAPAALYKDKEAD